MLPCGEVLLKLKLVLTKLLSSFKLSRIEVTGFN